MKTLLLLILLPLQLLSQDITGIWTGTIYNDTTQKYIPYQIAITENKGKLSGYSYTLFITGDKKETGVKSIKIKKNDEKVFIEDDKLIFNNYDAPPPKGVRQFSALTLSEKDTVFILSGLFTTNRTKEYLSLTGAVYLTKQKKFLKTDIVVKLDELKLASSLSFYQPDVKNDVAVQIPSKTIEPSEKKETQIAAIPVTQNTSQVIVKSVPQKKEVVKKEDPPKKTVLLVDPSTPQKETVNQTVVPQKAEVNNRNKNAEKKEVFQKKEPAANAETKVESKIALKEDSVLSMVEKDEISDVAKSKPLPIISTFDIEKRKIETIKTVFIKSDSLTITLYDNGEVDGDVVSVIMNGAVIIANQKLSTKPITKTIYITPNIGDSIQLIMYAENLGSIPPNTGLLILQDGNDRYEIRFAGDLQKNSAIILRRKSH